MQNNPGPLPQGAKAKTFTVGEIVQNGIVIQRARQIEVIEILEEEADPPANNNIAGLAGNWAMIDSSCTNQSTQFEHPKL